MLFLFFRPLSASQTLEGSWLCLPSVPSTPSTAAMHDDMAAASALRTPSKYCDGLGTGSPTTRPIADAKRRALVPALMAGPYLVTQSRGSWSSKPSPAAVRVTGQTNCAEEGYQVAIKRYEMRFRG